MKTLLLTGYDEAMKPLGDLTAPLMLAYASRHGMDFKCVRNYPANIPAYWEKMTATVEALDNGYDRVFWLDADEYITNPNHIPPWTSGFHASLDWGSDAADDSHFSMCGYIACPDAKFLFEWVIQNEILYIDQDFPEQTPMRYLYKNSPRARSVMGIESRKVFNNVPREVCAEAPEPWTKDDFAAHITHVSVEERVKIFYEIQKQIL
jgi:hypothetical protein